MTTTTAATGWVYEAPDPSVGMFGGGWMHDACATPDTDATYDVQESPFYDERLDRFTVRRWYHLLCRDCGGTAWVSFDDYMPDDDILAEMERVYGDDDVTADLPAWGPVLPRVHDGGIR